MTSTDSSSEELNAQDGTTLTLGDSFTLESKVTTTDAPIGEP